MSDLIHWYAPWSGRLLVGVIVLAALIGCAWSLRRRRLKSPHCPHCGYSLTRAVSDRCPECGGTSSTAQQHRGPRRWRLAGVFLLVVVGVPALVAARRMRQYGWDYYLTFGPGHYFFGTYTIDRVRIDGQSVRVVGDRAPGPSNGTLEVKSVGSTEKIDGWHWSLGEVLADRTIIGRGADITGNGRPNIIAQEYSGGAHCCITYYIYEVSPQGVLTQIARIEAQNGGSFEDRDGDGFPEFILPDWTWAYQLTCFACLACPEVVLKFDGTTYMPSSDLMLEPESETPDVAEWLQQAADGQAEIGNDVTSTAMRDLIWGEMLHLIYSGRAPQAWDLFDAGWNEKWGDKAENLAQFRSILRTSQFWSVVNELNGGTLD